MHVVVSGQARHVVCYRTLLQRLGSARRDGAVASVTLVHWRGQAELVSTLLKETRAELDRLILLDEPTPPSPGHFFHQVYSLQEGLRDRADADFVLRLRPDVYVGENFLARLAVAMPAFGRPLWTPYVDVTAPFFACDMVFGGRAAALRAQANYSVEPYLLVTPPGAQREPGKVYSHEPEVQRWLHPVRNADWWTRAYWMLFPSFGLVTPFRRALMAQYAGWDFYGAVRRGWLAYVAKELAVGGLASVGRLGLVRTDAAEATSGRVQWLDRLKEASDLASERTLDREAEEMVWTTEIADVRKLLAFLEAPAAPERPLTPHQARAELIERWRAAAATADRLPLRAGLRMPFTTSAVVF